MRVVVLRYGHRAERDKRVTTHVALVARAFGAEGIFLHGERDSSLMESIRKVNETWGGDFWAEWVDSYVDAIKSWKKEGGAVAHLTMYGEDLDSVVSELRAKDKLMFVVGSSKVPRDVYALADFNVAVGHQPHSEVAALAVALDRVFGGQELMKRFNGARLTIIPSKDGKIVLEAQGKERPSGTGTGGSRGTARARGGGTPAPTGSGIADGAG